MKLFAVVDRLLLGVLRIARALLGLALFGGAMLLAVVLALGVLVWALLRGRRPVAVRTVWRQAAARQPFGGGGAIHLARWANPVERKGQRFVG